MTYPINIEKLNGESMGTLPYILGAITIPENYPHLNKIKHLLSGYQERLSLDEIVSEFEERLDDRTEWARIRYSACENKIEASYSKALSKLRLYTTNYPYGQCYGIGNSIVAVDHEGDLNWMTAPTGSAVALTSGNWLGRMVLKVLGIKVQYT